jgi:hypothetical protein
LDPEQQSMNLACWIDNLHVITEEEMRSPCFVDIVWKHKVTESDYSALMRLNGHARVNRFQGHFLGKRLRRRSKACVNLRWALVVLDCGCTTLKIILRLRLQNFQHHTTTINKIYFPKGTTHGFTLNHQQQDMNNRILKI